ncbi:hypothetical protein MmiEs2_05070 [Methanimicrococcus stummii]|uniref:TIGR00304 family protein n=1 Tax=Methanimicrococcus stummii TaxID=3028294 RepID=A0AA96VL72_9EURY|nr:DUF131 domain-containing protein [Methanimicrococcus sp. Es2]WNY28322.1 hypothetical protein MmiEs2_05070 [Methanimicrococcus sp. Es2]
MADVNIYFFGPGLIYSILISIVLSILLTIGLNWYARKQMSKDFCHENNPGDAGLDYDFEDADSDGTTHTKTGGMILVGPIPIVFGNGKIGFDKGIFKYALVFFLIILILWFFLSQRVRL